MGIIGARALLGVALLGWAAWVQANPTQRITDELTKLLGSGSVKSVSATPMKGIYEVVMQTGEIFYTNEAVSHVLVGALFDAKTRENLTEKRIEELSKIDFGVLPLADAIVIKKGNGSRVFATFEDPNCGFCKRLTKELATLDHYTHYLFLLPVLGPASQEKAKRIWCAPNRAEAWQKLMLEGAEPPEAAAGCDTAALERNVQLGQKLGINGTPTIFLKSGVRISGFLPANQLEARLDKGS